MKKFRSTALLISLLISALVAACSPVRMQTPGRMQTPVGNPTPVNSPSPIGTPTFAITPAPVRSPTNVGLPTGTLPPTQTAEPVDLIPQSSIPVFEHIVIIILENEDYQSVIGRSSMPYFNKLAKENVLFTEYHGVSHPSLPNYIAMISGNTYNITSDCKDCFLNQPSLPDLIEKSGRTWKSYQEDMPSPCFMGDKGSYKQKHNPFVYFNSIRKDPARCQESVVNLDQLDNDLDSGNLPNFAFIMPNICNSGHDCDLQVADHWLKRMVEKLQKSNSLGAKSMIFITFDEGKQSNTETCCGLTQSGGRIAAVMVSPLAQPKFQDNSELTHYSLLKTILMSWDLPDLGQTKDPDTKPILAPWK